MIMLNLKYLTNIFLFFVSVFEFEYVYIVGFYYLLQDYFLIVTSYFKEITLLCTLDKEELKYFLVTVIFFSFLF